MFVGSGNIVLSNTNTNVKHYKTQFTGEFSIGTYAQHVTVSILVLELDTVDITYPIRQYTISINIKWCSLVLVVLLSEATDRFGTPITTNDVWYPPHRVAAWN